MGEQALSESGSIYIVRAVPTNSTLEMSHSNPFVFQVVMDAYFPNTFSPDGDDRNDFFRAEGKFVKSCTLEVFNSWGEQIYRTEDKEKGWDGTAKGKAAPQGTYMYRATYQTEDGKQNSKKGTVFLLRK